MRVFPATVIGAKSAMRIHRMNTRCNSYRIVWANVSGVWKHFETQAFFWRRGIGEHCPSLWYRTVSRKKDVLWMLDVDYVFSVPLICREVYLKTSWNSGVKSWPETDDFVWAFSPIKALCKSLHVYVLLCCTSCERNKITAETKGNIVQRILNNFNYTCRYQFN